MKYLLGFFILLLSTSSCKKEPNTPTGSNVAILQTAEIDSITGINIRSGGKVVYQGNEVLTGVGLCWSESSDVPTLSDSFRIITFATPDFRLQIDGLKPNTNYFLRAFASNSYRTVYGAVKNFQTNNVILPSLTLNSIANIDISSATLSGSISSNGNGSIFSYGFCYSSTAISPTLADTRTSASGIQVGDFSVVIKSLIQGTKYYIRAYAINQAGVAYGAVTTFTTLKVDIPTVTTNLVSNISPYAAISGGNIASNGNGTISTYGLCWSSSTTSPTTNNFTTAFSVIQSGSFSNSMQQLTPGTIYYVRAYAINQAGTAYGATQTFVTLNISLANVTTNSVTNIASSSAVASGSINSTGSGTISSYGFCWSSATSVPTTSNQKITFSSIQTGTFNGAITSLSQGTIYYIRAYVINEAGTSYGATQSFTTTTIILPTIATSSVSAITSNSATINGIINSTGNGTISSYGICWSSSNSSPTISNSKTSSSNIQTGAFSGLLTSLNVGTLYYARAYATNEIGTSYGSVLTFRTNN